MLTQNMLNQDRKNKLRWFVTLSTMPLLGVVTAFGLVPSNDLAFDTGKISVEQLVLPRVTPVKVGTTTFWHTERVQSGDTVAELMHRLNIKDRGATTYLRTSREAHAFRKLAPGKEVRAETEALGALIFLSYLDAQGTQIKIYHQDGNWHTNAVTAKLEKRLFVRTGIIKTTLYAATDAAGMPEAATNQLAQIFDGDIDFRRDLRRGDKFTAVYEMSYRNGALVKTGQIQAAEFINKGHVFRAIRFQDGMNQSNYYTPEGKSLRKAFLRSPIAYSRISSGFSTLRYHPILKIWRAHKGVDFAAPIGTPVKATSDGYVFFKGRKHGFGRVVILKHQRHLSTVYGHLSRFAKGLHNGERVMQGEIIAYVGMSGMATGPHLHYEFRINGQQHDPMRVALPNGKPISTNNKLEFTTQANKFIADLVQLRNTNLAKLD
ncbi:MAG: M23 family metallopeptidase [Gallionella sp.]